MDFRLKCLYEASYVGNVNSLKKLLEEDKLLLDRVITATEVSDNPLHIAAVLGYASFVREIIQRNPMLGHEINAQGMTPLHLAVAKGHVEVASALIEVYPNLCNVREKKLGYLPVHTAVMKGRHVLITLLSNNLDKLTDISETIMHLAVKAKRSETYQFLTDNYKDIAQHMLNSKDGEENTILHLAIASRQQKVILHLLSQVGIDVNSINSAGHTPLDVLLVTNNGTGDLYLGERLRTAGGKTAKELGVSEIINTNTSDPRLLSTQSNRMARTRSIIEEVFTWDEKTENEIYKNIEKNLIVVAALVATITFGAALNPPGGAIQIPFDDSKRNDTNWLRNWENMNTIYPAGSPVYLWQLKKFFKYDCIALYSSVLVILLSLPGIIRRNNITRKLLLVILWSSVYCMVIAFNSALSILLYTEKNSKNFQWMFPSFFLWFFGFGFVSGPLYVDFIFLLFHEAKEKIIKYFPRLSEISCPCAEKIKQVLRWTDRKELILLICIRTLFGAGIGALLGLLAGS